MHIKKYGGGNEFANSVIGKQILALLALIVIRVHMAAIEYVDASNESIHFDGYLALNHNNSQSGLIGG